jgi:tetratricopeptide (TPR) repeat protein/tRNA A-37 threonylcarbamoyl transferase component Bud32
VTGAASWPEVERAFDLAVAIPPGERAAFLDEVCHDPAVRREVEALLAADARATGFLDPAPAPRGYEPDVRIGPYRLLRKLGEGETSSVHLAERDDDQYRQQVAIKLIRPGMDSHQILQRFHQERRILASLSHPHIARLFDGGSTPAGQPYFVMEYVDGEPLDAHCEHHDLALARRLELFGQICQAVHYAHRNLVVHRDLKPGNILIDSTGTPKLVDFGIAKLLDPGRVAAELEPTAAVARLMTPHYASPEQVQGNPVSTASDVYSLGVILYKLVTGRRPYELGSLSLHEIERVVCEATPAPPSQLRARSRERLPRDLDNVVMMALRKEPERRYTSAQELADDVRRCVERRPVVARRDTLAYRVASFVRRNTGTVAATGVILLSLVVGAIATTWQWRHAVVERTRAETQRRIAEQTLEFLVELFRVPDSQVAVHEVTARELLDRGAARLQRTAHQPAEVHAALIHTLGVVAGNLGSYAQAETLLEQAMDERAHLPDHELALADSLYQLALLDPDGKPYTAVSLLRRALAIRSRLLGPDDPSVATLLEEIAGRIGYDAREAEDAFRRALAIRRRHAGGDDSRQIRSITGLAGLASLAGRYAEADTLLAEATALHDRAAGSNACDGDADELLNERTMLRLREGYFDEAERAADRLLACKQRALGPDHVAVVDFMSFRIAIWYEQGRLAEAEDLARRSLAARRAQHGDDTAAVDNALHHLARVLYARGQLAEAEQLETRSLALRVRAYGRSHDSVAGSQMVLGDIHLAAGANRDAEAAYREALAIWRRTMGEEHPHVAEAQRGVAAALVAQGRLDEARPLAEDALARQRRRLRPGHPEIATTLLVVAASAPSHAEPALREALAIRRAALAADHPAVACAESLLGACLAARGQIAEAIPLLRQGAETLQARLGGDHPDTRQARKRLQLVQPAPDLR